MENEQRQQEKERFTKQQQRVGKSTNLREKKDEAEDFRRQLKERSQAINVASLEERLGSKSATRPSPQQQDFRHLLRPAKPTDQSRLNSKHKPIGGISSREQVDPLEWQRSHQMRVHEGPLSSPGEEGAGGRFNQKGQTSQVNRWLGYDHHPERQREGFGRSNDPSKTSHRVDIQHEDSDDRYFDDETQF